MRRILVLMAMMAAAVLVASATAMAVTKTFSNNHRITIPDSGNADPYPSTIDVSRLSGTVQDVNVTIKRLRHTYPSDLVVTLEDPDGTQVELLGRAGDGDDVRNVTFTLDDEATGGPLPTPLQRGTYLPAQSLSSFDSHTANGVWKLYVEDTEGDDSGKIGGWSINITT